MTAVLFLGVQFISLFVAANAFFNSSQVGVAVTCSIASGSADMEHWRTSHDWRCRSWVPLSTSAAKFISRSLSVFFNSFVMWCYRNGFHYTLVHIQSRLLNLIRLALKIVSVSIETFTSTWSSSWHSPLFDLWLVFCVRGLIYHEPLWKHHAKPATLAREKDQTKKPGSPFHTLCQWCMGSLPSNSYLRTRVVRRASGL